MTNVAKVVIIDDQNNYLLLTRANHPHFGNDADIPGGSIEAGEEADEAVIREVKEEIGISELPIPTLVYQGRRYSHGFGEWSLYVLRLPSRPELSISWEHSEYEWLSRQEFIQQASRAKDSYMHMVARELSRQQYGYSAGGIVYDSGQVLTIEWNSPFRHSIEFPKGTLEDNETSEQAAVREVKEETGYTTRIIAPLKTIEYDFIGRDARPYHKQVVYFLMERMNDEEPHPQREDYELFENRWFSLDEAERLLTFPETKEMIQELRTTSFI